MKTRGRSWRRTLAASTIAAYVIAMAPVVVFAPLSALFMLIAVLPSIAVYALDADQERRRTFSIAVPNIAGALPVLFTQVTAHTEATLSAMASSLVWPYLGASLGGAIVIICRMYWHTEIERERSREISGIRNSLELIGKEWGLEIDTLADASAKAMQE